MKWFFNLALKETSDSSDDEELKQLLDQFKLAKLYKKLKKIGITSDILWDVPDGTLREKGLDDIEILLLSKARNNFKEKSVTEPGMNHNRWKICKIL